MRRPDQRALHPKLGVLEVEIGPLEAQRFAEPQPCRREHGPERPERIVAGAVEQRVDLGGA
jgi:hypothetical protein